MPSLSPRAKLTAMRSICGMDRGMVATSTFPALTAAMIDGIGFTPAPNASVAAIVVEIRAVVFKVAYVRANPSTALIAKTAHGPAPVPRTCPIPSAARRIALR